MKGKPSNAMQARIAALELKLSKKLVPTRVSVPKKKGARKGNGSRPLGPNSMKQPRALGGQNMRGGGGSSLGTTSTSRFRQTIEEDEYIGEVNGSVSFATTGYSINPGQSGTFPWGNKIAQLYERYDFNYLEFYICSEVSAFATQGQTGVVVLSCDYDSSDVAPTTKQQVEDTDPHTKPCLPSFQKPIRLILDCKEMRTSDAKYVRPGSQPANTDIKTYDAGVLYVSTQGNQNTSNIGELHVRYRCTLKKPVLESPTSLQGAVVHFSGTVPTTANMFATAALQSGGSAALSGITLGSNAITWPSGVAGNYLVSLSEQGATSVAAITSVSATLGCTVLNLLTSTTRDATSQAISLASTTGYVASAQVTVTVGANGGVLSFGPGAIVGGGTGMDLFIVSLPTTLLTVDEEEQLEINDLKLRLEEQERRISVLTLSSSSGSSSSDTEVLYQKLVRLGIIPADEEDECSAVEGDDGIVRVPDHVLDSSSLSPPIVSRQSTFGETVMRALAGAPPKPKK